MTLRAEIIAVGSELLTPVRMDTNSLWLTQQLNEYGIDVWQKHIIGDQKEHLVSLFREALNRSDFVFVSGGLGPTFDDITREAFAEAVGAELIFNPGIWEIILKALSKRDFVPPENNRRQGFVPQGANYVLNPVGSAPGIYMSVNNSVAALLPGPPDELKGVFKRMKKHLFRSVDLTPMHTKIFKMNLIPESHAEEKLKDIPLPENANWSILAAMGQVEAHLRITTPDDAEAEKLFDFFEKEMIKRVGNRYFATDDDSLESIVAAMLLDNKHSIAVAESCTGGWLGKRLTSISGSSEFMLGGIISYANQVKEQLLGVEHQAMVEHGAVSRQVALQMARGVKERLGSDLGISVTGVAGPTGGTDAKPVGTVYIAISGPGEKEMCHRFHFIGGRDAVRYMSTQASLEMVRLHYTGDTFDSAHIQKD